MLTHHPLVLAHDGLALATHKVTGKQVAWDVGRLGRQAGRWGG